MPNSLLLRLAADQRVRMLVETSSLTRPVVARFVAGETLGDALQAAGAANAQGMGAVLQYLGEHVASEAGADVAAAAYVDSLQAIASRSVDAHVSVKLSQLGLGLSAEGAVDRLRRICAAATIGQIRVAIDMETHTDVDATIAAYRAVRATSERPVLCLQAYLHRTEADVEALADLHPAIRLVKGAYHEPRDLAYGPWKTRDSFRRLLWTLLSSNPYTAVGTHDELMIKEAIRFAHRKGVPRDRFEFQLLYGVRRDLQESLRDQGYRVRVYIPFGREWYPYLMRRMAERPANLRLFLEALTRG